MATFNFGNRWTNPLPSYLIAVRLPSVLSTRTLVLVVLFGETVTLPSGQVVSAYDAKYATYLKLFTGEMFKAYERLHR